MRDKVHHSDLSCYYSTSIFHSHQRVRSSVPLGRRKDLPGALPCNLQHIDAHLRLLEHILFSNLIFGNLCSTMIGIPHTLVKSSRGITISKKPFSTIIVVFPPMIRTRTIGCSYSSQLFHLQYIFDNILHPSLFAPLDRRQYLPPRFRHH